MRLLLSFGAIFHRGRRRRRSVLGRIIVGVHRPHFSRNFEISLDIIYFFDLLIFPSYLLGYFLYTAFIDLTNIGFIDR